MAIEVDGSHHAIPEQADYDDTRSLYLESRGISVLRFWDNEVFGNLEGVLQVILDTATAALSSKNRQTEDGH